MVETLVQSTTDVVDFLKHQHNLIKDMFDEVLHASDPKAGEKASVDLRQLLAVHETAEEMVVHPRARREVADGDTRSNCRRSRRWTSPPRTSWTNSRSFATP